MWRWIQDRMTSPIPWRIRLALALLALPLALSLSAPLWVLEMGAPQYPEGLSLEISAYKVGGNVSEVNILNHYIGMASIDRAALNELDWLPFGILGIVLLALRAAAIGNNRFLVDLFVIFVYFSLFSFARFVNKLWVFGHDLDPKAPLTVEPFMPAVIGTKQIANFTITSMPAAGSVWLAVFGLGLAAILVMSFRMSIPRPMQEP